MPSANGRFLVLEGADGCGKSTQAARLVTSLREAGREVLHVRDPGSTKVAEGVRRLLLDPSTGHVGVHTETFLYMAARAQLAEEVIAPALGRGAVVVCERWTLSTEVYQGLAGGFGVDNVRLLAALAEHGTRPDRVLVLDVDVGGGLARLDGEPDRMEAKGGDFHAAVVRGYRRLAGERDDCVMLPSGDVEVVAAAVLEALRDLV
jgi:dTMP kinase